MKSALLETSSSAPSVHQLDRKLPLFTDSRKVYHTPTLTIFTGCKGLR